MRFVNEHGQYFNHENVEDNEQRQARQYIPSDAIVLELGARYGTVSCAINEKLLHKNHQLSVEPDATVWDALTSNRNSNGCGFSILYGAISRNPIGLELNGYATTTVQSNKSNIHTYTLEQIETNLGLQFDCLVADCEGFLGIFLEENPQLYSRLRWILFEKDYPDKCDYTIIESNLTYHGFVCVESGFHSVWKRSQSA
jgi:hypothetical protein